VVLLVRFGVCEVERRTRALSKETIVRFVNAMVICGKIVREESDRKGNVVLSYPVCELVTFDQLSSLAERGKANVYAHRPIESSHRSMLLCHLFAYFYFCHSWTPIHYHFKQKRVLKQFAHTPPQQFLHSHS
jgi:hypothetical protein